MKYSFVLQLFFIKKIYIDIDIKFLTRVDCHLNKEVPKWILIRMIKGIFIS